MVKVEDTFGREIEVEVREPLRLEVEIGSGDIIISRGEAGKLSVSSRFQVRAWSEERAREIAQRIGEELPIELDGNTVRIGDLKKYGLRFGTRFWGPQVAMSFEIIAPYDTSVDLDSGSGDQRVKELKGKGPVRAEAGSGDISLAEVAGEVKAEASSGDVRLSP